MLQGLRLQDLKQERVNLHRDINVMLAQMGMTLKEFKRQLSTSNTDHHLHEIDLLGKWL